MIIFHIKKIKPLGISGVKGKRWHTSRGTNEMRVEQSIIKTTLLILIVNVAVYGEYDNFSNKKIKPLGISGVKGKRWHTSRGTNGMRVEQSIIKTTLLILIVNVAVYGEYDNFSYKKIKPLGISGVCEKL